MYQQVNYSQAKALMEQEQPLVIADVRDKASFDAAHIEGAIHLSVKALGDFCDANQKDVAILVYCYHGISSQSVAQHLLDKGFSRVYSLIGGFEAWMSQHSTSKN